MENQATSSNTDTAVKVVQTIFGATHFVFQTLADLTLHAEVKTVQAITKNTPNWKSKEQIIMERIQGTSATQTKILTNFDKIKQGATKPAPVTT
jgi:hypothetical protein